VDVGFSCKKVPKPGFGNSCAANMAWVYQANKTVTSVMDGHCLTLSADGSSLTVQTCKPQGDKAVTTQLWAFSDDTEGGSAMRSLAHASGDGICIDDGPAAESLSEQVKDANSPSMVSEQDNDAAAGAGCVLYAAGAGATLKGAGKTVLGGMHPGGSYSNGRGCAATLKAAAFRFDPAEVLWSSPSFGTTSSALHGPAPSQVSQGSVIAITDAPRIVPPAWGGTPPPTAADAASAQYVQYKNVSGWDLYNGADDVYIFISPASHAQGLATLRQDFFSLAGGVPLLPPWAFGLWFTWYHPYTQSEKMAEITRFIGDDLGLDVASLDRNWRLYGGTSGAGPQEGLYTENTTLLPDLDGFFKWVHNHSLHVFFNDHPKPISYGNQSHPPKAGDPNYPIPLDEMPLGVKETAFRWEGLTSLMARGLDYWWYDCHWAWSAPSIGAPGTNAHIDGTTWGQAVLDYSQQRFMASGTNGTAVRPGDPAKGASDDVTSFQMGCTGSTHPTSHRYGVHWTGDNFDNHLLTAVSRTIMGGIEGFKPYVHADCTAHHGHDEPEIYVRWIQFCSLSNVFRVHSDPWNDRRPWSFENATGNESGPPHVANPESTEGIFRNFSKSRLQLNPMYASAAIKAAIDGTPLVQRLDFAYPTALPGAALLDQYLLLGDGMLVAPVNPFVNKTKDWVDPKTPGTFNRSRTVWIPPSTSWEDAFTGEVVSGAATTGTTLLRKEVPLAQTILYHKRPSMIVTARRPARNAARTDLSSLVLEVFASSHKVKFTGLTQNSQVDPEV
jgi:hypothetical protein